MEENTTITENISIAQKLLDRATKRYYTISQNFRIITEKSSDPEIIQRLSRNISTGSLTQLDDFIAHLQSTFATRKEFNQAHLALLNHAMPAIMRSFDLIIRYNLIEAHLNAATNIHAANNYCETIKFIVEPLREKLLLIIPYLPLASDFCAHITDSLDTAKELIQHMEEKANTASKALMETLDQSVKTKKKPKKKNKKKEKPTLPPEFESAFIIKDKTLVSLKPLTEIFSDHPHEIIKLLTLKLRFGINIDEPTENYLTEKGAELKPNKAIYEELKTALTHVASPDEFLQALANYHFFANTKPFTLQSESPDYQIFSTYNGLTLFSHSQHHSSPILHQLIDESNPEELKIELEINGGIRFINTRVPEFNNMTPLELAMKKLNAHADENTVSCVALLLSHAVDYGVYVKDIAVRQISTRQPLGRPS